SRVANRLDLAGPAYTLDAACASSLLAIDHAVAELVAGRCDVVLAGGVHHCHDITLWSVFSQLGALSPSQRIRPFHRDADGMLIGEGTGMVVLKRLADATGDRIYAVIRGTGIASDGRASSLMSPRADGQARAIERAWQAAGLDPTEAGALGLLEAHGTGTPAGDQTELTCLTQIFGPPNGAGHDIGIGSVKSMIGHTMPAAGIAGLIKAALAVHHGVLPPTLHCDDPHPALANTRFTPITAAKPWAARGRTPLRAGVDAFGFGGINAHAILEQPPRTRHSPSLRLRGRERVLMLVGNTPAELAGQLAVSDSVLLDRDEPSACPSSGPCRLAIVGPSPRRLLLARRIVAQGKPWRGRDDIWFTTAPLHSPSAPAQLAFVFPGLEQEFHPRTDDVAEHFQLDRPRLGDNAALGQHAIGVLTVGRLLDAALRELGVVPDLVAGHSIGEWNAMNSAGIHPREAVEDVIASFDPATLRVPGLVFAALGCGADQAAEAISGVTGIVVSHDNCPHQSIICGDEAAVVSVLTRLQARGTSGQVLPFRSGFHSPMLEPYLRPILHTFASVPVHPSTIPVWSATTVDTYPDRPEDIRALVARHLLEPVRFGPLVRRLYEAGVRAFVQVGTGSLPAFVADTLTGLPHLAITANTAHRCGLDQLRRVAAALWVEGWAPRFDRLPSAATSIASPPTGHAMALGLGSPLIRLGPDGPTLTRTLHSPAQPQEVRQNPVLAEFDAALRDATAAARMVTDSWAAAPAKPASRTRATTTRLMSLDTMPYLVDHCLFPQPPGWPEAADRYPVVPMTTTLELMAQAARDLVPGRTIVGIKNIRALRFLPVEPPVTVMIEATVDGDRNVAVMIDDYAHGTVLLADSYPAPPAAADSPLVCQRPCEVTPAALYGDRWMFHGPLFQGVAKLGPIGDDGIRGVLAASPVPGALLDNAGQLLGFWIMQQMHQDRLAFPASIDRVSWYGLPPSPGEQVSCVVRIGSVSDTKVVADLELRVAGRLYARIDRWTDRRFRTDEVTWPAFFFPERNLVAQRQPGGVFLVRDRWRDPGSQELAMRRYLGAAERAEYSRRNPRAARQWLLGRIAVKDAVRRWLWDSGAGPIYPVEITVSNDERGRPVVTGPFATAPAVSLAHSGPLAVAVVGGSDFGDSPGVDIELVEARDAATEAAILTELERRLLDDLCGRCPDPGSARDGWLTRFWTAKEAVAKAEGTGLGGIPHRFGVERLDGDRLLVRSRQENGHSRTRWVGTALGAEPEPYALAWTEGGETDDA
ncbi:MAG: polyketide synthase dehydratase domain-containing protein, partial [Actinomycetota bacterium]|nr:polyketide synthase dehydratase domain-containing protein [Actinomycetota bacterium]